MNDLLKKQYQLIMEAREVVFQYLGKDVAGDLTTELPEFNNKSIAYMMTHIANTYVAWAGNFALSAKLDFYEITDGSNVDQLREIFNTVNQLMEQFILHFSENPYSEVKGYKWPDKFIETDAYSIFTHVITHEFHHKGQSMTMSRLLGYSPPDTDILRFN